MYFTSDAASSRSLLRPGCRVQDSDCGQNCCSDSAAHAVACSVSPRCTIGSVWPMRQKSKESTMSAHFASDPASSRSLLCRGGLKRDSDSAHNCCSDTTARAAACSVPPRSTACSVWLLRRNRRKAPRECNPHQIQPQVARSSALGAEYGTPIVLGTAIATRPPVLWLPEYIRGALLGSCG